MRYPLLFPVLFALACTPSPKAPGLYECCPGKPYPAKGTAYFPDDSAMEGGFEDRIGNELHTLQDFLEGTAPYVSVAIDNVASADYTPPRYGAQLCIPELNAKYRQKIDLRAVDTGSAFRGKKFSRVDVCVENKAASMDPTINGALTLVVCQ